MAEPGFGSVFTDHMTTIRWTEERGWHDARLEPYGPITLDPAAAVFHYGQEIFEGLKAYAQADGRVVAFRPQANAARFNRSARPAGHARGCPRTRSCGRIEVLVGQDRDWVPTSRRAQPLPAAVHDRHPARPRRQQAVGVLPVHGHRLAGGRATSAGPSAVTVWLSDDYTRAAPGGTGEAKCGGNYAAAFAGQHQALEHGCDQVVWLDAAERRWVEEMGGMNLFFVYGSGAEARMMTPAADRLAAARHHQGLAAQARPRPGHPDPRGPDLGRRTGRSAAPSGEITEVFACGTAAVITPVGAVRSAERRLG